MTGFAWSARRARESVQAIGSRGPRALLTALGLAVGVGGFVTTATIGQSASAQIARDLDALRSSSLEIQPVSQDSVSASRLLGAESAVGQLPGVVETGFRSQAQSPSGSGFSIARRHGSVEDQIANLICATNSYLTLVGAQVQSPPAPTGLTQSALVGSEVLVGTALAGRIGLTPASLPTVVWVGSDLRTVTGIVEQTTQDPDLLLSVVVNATSCDGGVDLRSTRLLIRVAPGWGSAIRDAAPYSVAPDAPGQYLAVSAAEATELRSRISSSNSNLLLAISTMALVLGGVVVCMTMLVAVLERRSEIGVRRAVGATRTAIAVQFTTEAALLGLLGGLLGSAVGSLIGAAVAFLRDWPSGLSVIPILIGPVLGLALGAIAGLYPAIRAARVEPLEALRS